MTAHRPGQDRPGVRGLSVFTGSVAVIVLVGLAVLAACSSDDRVAESETGATGSASSTGSTAPSSTTPPVIVAAARPSGAADPGTAEWYQGPAPDGHRVTLGVYRPVGHPKGSVMILNGADGLRRQYEDLAARFSARGYIAVVGCWYDKSAASRAPDAIDCPNGPAWKGMNAASVADVDALVAAIRDVPGIDAEQIVLVGHSAGGGVALLRAGLENTNEPVVSSSGLLARTPGSSATDLYAIDHAATIRVPVFVIHGTADPICPLEQAQAFVAALTRAGNPPKTLYLDAPANHAFPFQGEACGDDPAIALSDRYVREVVDWMATLPSRNGRR